jgi:dienelactone hydrolase
MKSVFVIRVVGLTCLAVGALRLWNGQQQSLADALVEAQAPEMAPRLPRDQLLVYRDPEGDLRPIQGTAEWPRRRREILAGMRQIMGELPSDEAKRVPLDVEVVREDDCGSYLRQLITYASEPGSRVPAYLCLPKTVLGTKGRRVPAVLCLHGTDDVVGHGTVVGLGSRPNRQYAAELAERGFITLAPSYPRLAKYQPDLAGLGWQSGTLKAVWDNQRGLDYLSTLPEVDATRGFGAIGHSLGGHNSVYTAVFDQRITMVVSSCGLDSFLDYYGGDPKRWQPGQGWTQTLYMPRLAEYHNRLDQIPFDFQELIGALAPRRVLLIAPTRDHNFQATSVDRIARAAGEVYALFGHPERLTVLHPDCEHDFPNEVREQAYQVLAEVLRPEPGPVAKP